MFQPQATQLFTELMEFCSVGLSIYQDLLASNYFKQCFVHDYTKQKCVYIHLNEQFV